MSSNLLTTYISSIGYAKQEDVCERAWQQHWDLVIINEANTCMACIRRSTMSSGNILNECEIGINVTKLSRWRWLEGLN